MIVVKPWLERSFSFDLPIWMYPHLVERVRGGPVRLSASLNGFPGSLLTVRVGDSWSIQENAGHLLDIEELMATRLSQLLSGDSELIAWDGRNEKTWAAKHNQADIRNILSSFALARETLLSSLDALDEAQIERSALHPRLKKQMRFIDLVSFIAEHDDYHLAKITALKSSILRTPSTVDQQ